MIHSTRPYDVFAIAAAPSDDLAPACQIEGGDILPSPRLVSLADEMPWASFLEACEPSWDAHLERIADAAANAFPMCYPQCVEDVGEAPGLQVDCKVGWTERKPDGSLVDGTLPRCEDGPDDPIGCWEVRTDDALHPACADEGFNLELRVRWPGDRVPDEDITLEAYCEPSDDWTVDCPRPP